MATEVTARDAGFDPQQRTIHGKHDLRLVPAAGSAWLTAFVGVRHGWWAAALVAAVSGLVGTVGFWRARRRPSARGTSRIGMWAALVLCAATVATLTTLRINTAETDPLRTYATQHAAAALRVVVEDRPLSVDTPGYAGSRQGTFVVVPTTVESAVIADESVSSSARITIVTDAAQWAQLLPGQHLTVHGILDEPRETDLTAAVVHARGPPREVTEPPWWQRAAASLRSGLHNSCAALDDGPAGLLPGLVVGDTSELPSAIADEFTAAGLSHLTAVSGTHLNIVCGAVLLLLRSGRAGPRLTAALTGGLLVGFVVLVGPQPSVLRAVMMSAVGLVALATGRQRATFPALAVAVIGVVTYDPNTAVSFAFALSVAATTGIVVFVPRWSGMLTRRRVPRAAAVALAVPAAASLTTIPIVAGMAGRVSLVAVPANLLANPVVAPVLLLGIVAMLLAPISPTVAEFSAWVAEFGLQWLIWVAHHAVRIPGATLSWFGGWWGGLLALSVVVGVALLFWIRAGRTLLGAVTVGAVLVLIPARVLAPPWPPSGWSVVACDVGQGDGLVLRTGAADGAVVVDTGPAPVDIDRCLDRLGVTAVALVVLTHLHADHIGGLQGVLREHTVGAVALGPGRNPEWARRQVVEHATAAEVPLRSLHSGQSLRWPELRLTVLTPEHGMPSDPVDPDSGTAVNNTSVVLRADTPAGRVLLTGDVELAAQAQLLASDVELSADVLKVPHHGSDVFLPRFLAAVSPRLAVISVGSDNDYGHPSARLLRALRDEGVVVARTDRAGALAVVAEGSGRLVVREHTPR